jgi:trimethylamine:corrinoid methyltransferase-like protein
MFVNKMPRYEILSQDAIATLDTGWRRLMTEIGVEFMDDRALDLFRQAGQKVQDNTVFLDPDFVLEQVAKAPGEFDVQARNPENSITSVATTWRSVRCTARRSYARARCAATRRWTTSATSPSSPSRPVSSTPRVASSASPTTRHWTRGTST